MKLDVRSGTPQSRQRGFSAIEMVTVVLIIGILAAFAIPKWLTIRRNLRISGDARSLAGDLSVAKMRAAANFTAARVFLYTGSDPYFRIDIWNKTANGGNPCWVPDGASSPAAGDCIVGNNSTKYDVRLSQGVTPGFGSVSTAPADTGITLTQGGACRYGGPAAYSGASTIASSSCVVFNSRGFPVDSTGSLAARSLYITDGSMVYGVSVTSVGLMHVWSSSASGSGNWVHQ
jgi:prepilin-type N-terminal cleavage/methylation domain-containing protein